MGVKTIHMLLILSVILSDYLSQIRSICLFLLYTETVKEVSASCVRYIHIYKHLHWNFAKEISNGAILYHSNGFDKY